MASKKGRRGHGEGSIYQRKSDGRWVGSVDLGYINGKRKRRPVYGKTQAEVRDKLRALQRQHDDGLNLAAEKQTVAEYVKRWLRDIVEPTLLPKTYESYEEQCRLNIVPYVGNIQLQRLTPDDVQSMIRSLQKRELAPRTVQYAVGVLSRALNKAVKRLYLSRNVVQLVDVPKVPKRKIEPLTVEQAQTLLQAVNGHRLAGLYLTAISTGLRRGELLVLQWDDLDLDKRTLFVRKSKTPTGVRTLSMHHELCEILRAHKDYLAEERVVQNEKWLEHGLVFPSEVGTPLNPTNLHRHFKRVLAKAGLPNIRFHDLRHTCATFLLSHKVGLHVVKETLGHAKASTTSDFYGHILVEVREEVSGIMGELLKKEKEA